VFKVDIFDKMNLSRKNQPRLFLHQDNAPLHRWCRSDNWTFGQLNIVRVQLMTHPSCLIVLTWHL